MNDPALLLMYVNDMAGFLKTETVVSETQCPNVVVLHAGEWSTLVPPGVGLFLSPPSNPPQMNTDGAWSIWDWGIGVFIASPPGASKTDGLIFCLSAASAIRAALEFAPAFWDLRLDATEPLSIHVNDNSSTVVSLNYAKNFPL